MLVTEPGFRFQEVFFCFKPFLLGSVWTHFYYPAAATTVTVRELNCWDDLRAHGIWGTILRFWPIWGRIMSRSIKKIIVTLQWHEIHWTSHDENYPWWWSRIHANGILIRSMKHPMKYPIAVFFQGEISRFPVWVPHVKHISVFGSALVIFT